MEIAWDESMRTGLPEIDRQHQELIQQLNELYETMLYGAGEKKLTEVLQFVGEYANFHFQREEECMHRYRCPAADINRNAHAQFLATFTGLAGRLQTEGPTEAVQLAVQRELLDWFLQHIKGVDTQLRPCVEAGQAGPPGDR